MKALWTGGAIFCVVWAIVELLAGRHADALTTVVAGGIFVIISDER
jgi:hypothetical protein